MAHFQDPSTASPSITSTTPAERDFLLLLEEEMDGEYLHSQLKMML